MTALWIYQGSPGCLVGTLVIPAPGDETRKSQVGGQPGLPRETMSQNIKTKLNKAKIRETQYPRWLLGPTQRVLLILVCRRRASNAHHVQSVIEQTIAASPQGCAGLHLLGSRGCVLVSMLWLDAHWCVGKQQLLSVKMIVRKTGNVWKVGTLFPCFMGWFWHPPSLLSLSSYDSVFCAAD